MKKALIENKKMLFVLGVLVILALCAVMGIRRQGEQWTVVEDPESGYTYAAYEDHVELLKYTGREEEVTVPDMLAGKPVTVIWERCFSGKAEIRTVHLGGNIQKVSRYAFQGCRQLEQVSGDAQLETISEGAFYSCELLKTVEAGSRIKRIESFAFAHCWALESIGEQPELEYIGTCAFMEAGRLSDFRLPEETEVETRAFTNSQWFSDRLVENRAEEFVVLGEGTLVAYNGKAQIVEIPYGITRVDQFVFKHRSIEEIHLPETVKEVESMAFEGCGNVRVYMPDSVTALDTKNLMADPKTKFSRLGEETDKITIVTTRGSYAEKYAKKYKVDCEIVEPWW